MMEDSDRKITASSSSKRVIRRETFFLINCYLVLLATDLSPACGAVALFGVTKKHGYFMQNVWRK